MPDGPRTVRSTEVGGIDRRSHADRLAERAVLGTVEANARGEARVLSKPFGARGARAPRTKPGIIMSIRTKRGLIAIAVGTIIGALLGGFAEALDHAMYLAELYLRHGDVPAGFDDFDV